MKKIVEISAMCGVSARIELQDPLGNIIVLEAGKKSARESCKSPKNTYHCSNADVFHVLFSTPNSKTSLTLFIARLNPTDLEENLNYRFNSKKTLPIQGTTTRNKCRKVWSK